MFCVPAHRLPQPFGERYARPPAQLSFDLAAINGIAAVVSRAIRYVTNHRARLAQDIQEGMGQFQVGAFAAAADVVRVADLPVFPNLDDGFTVVADMDPVAHVLAV